MVGSGRARRIKRHRTYEIIEAAEVVDVSPQTVRAWIKQGLPVIDDRRPFLILGEALKEFLSVREVARKRPLRLGEFYCFRCKKPATSALGYADYVKVTVSSGRLETFCALCDGACSRMVRRSDLPLWAEFLEIGGTVATHP